MHPDDSLKLAQHLCTRLCHDLAGPIGAISNGAEFLSEAKDMQGDALELVLSSAKEGVARLQFFRHAYGKLNDHGEANLQEKKQLVQAFFASSKIALDWPDQHTDAAGVSVSQKMAQLLFNMIVIVAHTLLRGGTLSVRIEKEGGSGRKMTVGASGPTIKSDEEVEKILGGAAPELSPTTAQAALTAALAADMDVAFRIEKSDSGYALIAARGAK